VDISTQLLIANELKLRFPDAEFYFVGAEDKMEKSHKLICYKGLWIAGLQRQINLKMQCSFN
jgi:UDP-N-acetylglucosamine--N-acetylmuramyl-(pentapeptide) pyrophosphoryl-undecaprenol N-acetylglucosamine transferase